jgi:hypothetical protein
MKRDCGSAATRCVEVVRRPPPPPPPAPQCGGQSGRGSGMRRHVSVDGAPPRRRAPRASPLVRRVPARALACGGRLGASRRCTAPPASGLRSGAPGAARENTRERLQLARPIHSWTRLGRHGARLFSPVHGALSPYFWPTGGARQFGPPGAPRHDLGSIVSQTTVSRVRNVPGSAATAAAARTAVALVHRLPIGARPSLAGRCAVTAPRVAARTARSPP